MSSTFMGSRDYAPSPIDDFTRNVLRANNSNFAFDGVLLSLRIFALSGSNG